MRFHRLVQISGIFHKKFMRGSRGLRLYKIIGQRRRLRHRPELKFRAARSLRDPQSSVETDETRLPPPQADRRAAPAVPARGQLKVASQPLAREFILGRASDPPLPQCRLICCFVKVQRPGCWLTRRVAVAFGRRMNCSLRIPFSGGRGSAEVRSTLSAPGPCHFCERSAIVCRGLLNLRYDKDEIRTCWNVSWHMVSLRQTPCPCPMTPNRRAASGLPAAPVGLSQRFASAIAG